jgi:hypothetical protein
MSSKELTFEEINDAIEKLNLADFSPGGKRHLTAEAVKANPAAAFPQICPIYKVIRPILVALLSLVLIPQKWRNVIKAFVGIMDAICP